MKRCLELARQGLGKVAPNPMVGCVIVYNDEIIGEGFHEKYGEGHAEVNAIKNCIKPELLEKSTVYVSLEPCSHFGKTPPCADLLIKAKVKKVVICNLDSNPLVAGKGIEKLRTAGIEVISGILEEEGRELNKRFFYFHEKKLPSVILKWAQTNDGFIDIVRQINDNKLPLKISNSETNKTVHQWRSEEQAILVGTNTAMLDNPSLTVRHVVGKNPIRILIDKNQVVPNSNHIFNKEAQTLVFNAIENRTQDNVEWIKIEFNDSFITNMLHILFQKNIQSLIVEGGSKMLQSFINSGLWNEARVICSEQNSKEGVKAPLLIAKEINRYKILDDTITIYQA